MNNGGDYSLCVTRQAAVVPLAINQSIGIALIFLVIAAFISDIINFNRFIKQSEERERKESEDNNND